MDLLPGVLILQIGNYIDNYKDLGALRCSSRRYYILLGNIFNKFTYIRMDEEYCGEDKDGESETESRLFLNGRLKLEIIFPRDNGTMYFNPSAIGRVGDETIDYQMWEGSFYMENKRLFMMGYRHHMGMELFLTKLQEARVLEEVQRFYKTEHPDEYREIDATGKVISMANKN